MSKNNDLITLKEASELTGYSPDYIGQLIRSGKITGRQVYTNITWMTTAAEIINYIRKAKNKKENTLKESIGRQTRLLGLQVNSFKMVLQNFPSLKYWFLILFVSFFILSLFILFTFFSHQDINNLELINNVKPNLTF